MLILVIGDFYIPERAIDLPHKFKKLLLPGKISTVLATGQPSPSIQTYLESICRTVIPSKGKQVVEYEGWRIGMVDSGHMLDNEDRLEKAAIARSLDVDVLVSNGGHQFEAYSRDLRFFVDPGSCTGAFSLHRDEVVPSFVLMDMNAESLSLYIYMLVEGQVKVEKIDFRKPGEV